MQFDKNDADTLVGVIARSAGVWDSKRSSFSLPDGHSVLGVCSHYQNGY